MSCSPESMDGDVLDCSARSARIALLLPPTSSHSSPLGLVLASLARFDRTLDDEKRVLCSSSARWRAIRATRSWIPLELHAVAAERDFS
jgi:hypothetical protein